MAAAGMKTAGPTCGCCTCVLLRDDFAGTLSSDWVQVSGSWSISGGNLATSSTSAMVVHTTAVPNNKGKFTANTSSITSPDTAKWRMVAYLDANNYAYIEFSRNATFTSNYDLKLGYFSGGSETVLDTKTNLDAGAFVGSTDLLYRLCWDGTRLVGGLNNATLSGAYTAPNGLRPGFATGSSGSSWQFISAELAYHNEERPSCPTCMTCWDICETFPSTIEVYIPAGTFSNHSFSAADDWFCNGGCDALNDQTYVLNLTSDGDLGDITHATRTACPMYEYLEEDFCDIENPSRAGSHPATLRILARWYMSGSAGQGYIEITILVYSECVGFNGGFCGDATYGNITRYKFLSSFIDISTPPIPSWSPCVDAEYETDEVQHETSFGPGETFCFSRAGSLSSCQRTRIACDIDDTKTLTITIP
jgi:hypothetical protein